MTKSNISVEDLFETFGERYIMVEHRLIHQGMPEENGKHKELVKTKAAIIAHFHQALLSGLPERNDMKHAKDAHSDAGAGHVIGFNYCLDQVEELINKVFNKEEK